MNGVARSAILPGRMRMNAIWLATGLFIGSLAGGCASQAAATADVEPFKDASQDTRVDASDTGVSDTAPADTRVDTAPVDSAPVDTAPPALSSITVTGPASGVAG